MVSLGFGQKATDILEKVIEARGGKKVLESIKDTSMSGFWEFTHKWIKNKMDVKPVSMPMKFYHKEPNKFRLDTERRGKKATMQAFDGETTWKINHQTGIAEEELSEEFKKLALIQAFNFGNSALLHPEKYGITYTYKGKKNIEIEGKDYFVLEQTFSNGYKASLYVDSKTYLIFIVEAEWSMVFYDYKKIDGVMFAHSVSFIREQFYNLTFTEVKFNSGLEDSLFKMSK
jgi:outer membrane lipoprotein-sorting protein